MDQDVGIFQNRFHALRIGNEVGGQVAAVELHAFDDFQLGLHRLGLFHGDDAVLADLLHRFRDDAADGLVIVGGDGADLRDHLAGNLLRQLVESGILAGPVFFLGTIDGGNSLLDAALQGHRVRTGGNRLHAFAIDGLRQNGRGGGAVAGNVGRLGGNFAHHLRAHVLERILQLNFLGYGNAVLGDKGRTKFLLDHDVAALGTERNFHSVGQNIHAAKNRLP